MVRENSREAESSDCRGVPCRDPQARTDTSYFRTVATFGDQVVHDEGEIAGLDAANVVDRYGLYQRDSVVLAQHAGGW